jgi:hypothetical protein
MVVQAEVVLLRALQQRHEPRPHRELATRARRRCSNSPPGGGVGEGGGDETPAAAASWRRRRRRPSPARASSRASYRESYRRPYLPIARQASTCGCDIAG